jgi:hypothetical protein
MLGPRQRAFVLGAVLAGSAVLAHLPALWTSFMADDYDLLRAARRVEDVLWPFDHNDLGEPGSAGHFYRPVWLLWHAGVFQVFGAEPAAFHAANLLLFAVMAVEVWLLARYVLGEPAAWIAGLAFAVYPRHSEAVVWVAGSTDLLSGVLGLGALLCLGARWPPLPRALGAAAFAAAAAATKEAAFALPLLGALLLWARPTDETPRRRWLPLAALAGAQLGVIALRSAVLDGVGGYSGYPWRPLRVVAAAASDVVASLTPAQLQVLRHPVLFVIPLLALGALTWATLRLRQRDERRRLRVVVLGLAWFVAALVPALNLTVDLNNANGERRLLMPSVGLALAFGALIGPRLRRRLPLAAAVIVLAALSVHNAHNWLVAGRIADRLVADAAEIGPERSELVLLSVPASYRSARVFQVSLDAAVQEVGRSDLEIATCLPVQILESRASQIVFERRGDGSYRGVTTWSAPFDFPVLRTSVSPGRDCTYSRDDGESWPPGIGRAGLAYPAPRRERVFFAFFDGKDLRPCCPPEP